MHLANSWPPGKRGKKCLKKKKINVLFSSRYCKASFMSEGTCSGTLQWSIKTQTIPSSLLVPQLKGCFRDAPQACPQQRPTGTSSWKFEVFPLLFPYLAAKKHSPNTILGSKKSWRLSEGLTPGASDTSCKCSTLCPEGRLGCRAVEGENLCHCHKATHQSRADLSKSEIPLPAHFVGVSRVAKPFVVISCFMQTVFASCCKHHLLLFPSDGYDFTSHPDSWKLFGSKDALLLCKAVPRQSQHKGVAHVLFCPGTTLPLIHTALAGQVKATQTGKCS